MDGHMDGYMAIDGGFNDIEWLYGGYRMAVDDMVLYDDYITAVGGYMMTIKWL